MHLARLTTVISISVVASFIGGSRASRRQIRARPDAHVRGLQDHGYGLCPCRWLVHRRGGQADVFDPADITKSSLNVTIKTASIDTHFAQPSSRWT